MISSKLYPASVVDGNLTRFLSDFIIPTEQHVRVYNYVYDPVNGSDITDITDPVTGLNLRKSDVPASTDLVGLDLWDLVDNSISFYTAPVTTSSVYLEVATAPEEFGGTIVQPAVDRALAAADQAEISETNAAASAAAALASENAAATSETNAATSASTATTQAGIATTKAGEASASASAASTSASNASTSATNAAASESAAATSETNAATSASASATSASASSTSATASAASASAASTSAGNAATSETNAAASEAAAAASATDAEASKSNMSSVTAEALRQANRDKFAGSGFVEMGKHSGSASFPNVNDGIWTIDTYVDTFLIGFNSTDSGETGTSETLNPIVNANGSIININSINYTGERSHIKLPDAPTVTHADSSNSGLILNGKFDTDTTWTKGTGWSIGSGVASITSSASTNAITQTVGVADDTYTIEFEIKSISAGGFRIYAGGTVSDTFNTVGRHEASIICGSSNTLVGVQCSAIGTTGSIDNVAVFPADEISRDDLSFLEVFYEDITEKDFVYPLGNVQYLGADTDGLTGIANGAFTGFGTYSLFGNWQTSSALIGKGYVWSTMNVLQRIAFVSNPANGVEFDGDTPVQRRYRMRVVQGLGDEWANVDPNASYTSPHYGLLTYKDSANKCVVPKGSKTSISSEYGSYATTGGYAGANDTVVAHHQNGMFQATGINTPSGFNGAYEGKCYALPIALIHRRNRGARHKTFNPNGANRWVKTGVGYDLYEHQLLGGDVTSIAQCFTNFTSGVGRDATSGYISSANSGRADGLFYDQIHEGDIKDLRSDANGITDKTKFTLDEIGNAVSGDTRGAEGEIETIQVNQENATSTTAYIDVDPATFSGDVVVGSSIYHNGLTARILYVEHLAVDRLHLDRSIAHIIDTPAWIAVNTTRTKSNTLTHTDIIGDPANWYRGQTWTNTGASQTVTVDTGDVIWVTDSTPVGTTITGNFYKLVLTGGTVDISTLDYGASPSWTDLGSDWDGAGSWRKDGVNGSPLLVGEKGEDYLDEVTYTLLSDIKVSKKGNVFLNGTYSFDYGVTWTAFSGQAFNTNNTLASGLNRTGGLFKLNYTTHTDMTESSAYIEPLTDSVKVKAITDKASAAFVQSVINKVPVGSQVQDATFTLDDTHTTLTLTESSPAVKVEASLVAVNGKAYTQLTGREVKWNTSVLGDDGILPAVDNVGTDTDDNADTILVFNKLIPTNKFIADKE